MDESHGSSDASDTPQTSWFDALSDVDLQFVQALHQLRRERTREKYGLGLLKNMGPVVVMTNQRLERIAECARAHKLCCVESLYREMRWRRDYDFNQLEERVVRLANEYVSFKCGLFCCSYSPHSFYSIPRAQESSAMCLDVDESSSSDGGVAVSSSGPQTCGVCGSSQTDSVQTLVSAVGHLTLQSE